MRVARQISRVCSRIASIDVSKSIAAYFARFFTAASTWVGNLLKSSTSELYIEPTGRNCFKGNGAAWLEMGADILLGDDWELEFQIEGEAISSTKYFIGNDINLANPSAFAARYNGTNILVGGYTAAVATWDVAITFSDIMLLTYHSNELKLYKNGVLISGSNTVGILDNLGYIRYLARRADTAFNFTAGMQDFKLWKDGVLAHRFPLDQWKAGSTPPSVRYSDVTGGITATLVNGTVPDNLGARSDNSKSYNWNGFTLDGDEYVPAKDDGSGLDVDGNPLTNPALNNGSAHNGNEQKMRFTTVPQELIDIDVDNQFQVAGVATEWYPQDVAAAYIEKTVTANGSVTDLKIKG